MTIHSILIGNHKHLKHCSETELLAFLTNSSLKTNGALHVNKKGTRQNLSFCSVAKTVLFKMLTHQKQQDKARNGH